MTSINIGKNVYICIFTWSYLIDIDSFSIVGVIFVWMNNIHTAIIPSFLFFEDRDNGQTTHSENL